MTAHDPHDWTPWKPSVIPGRDVVWRECRTCPVTQRRPGLSTAASSKK